MKCGNWTGSLGFSFRSMFRYGLCNSGLVFVDSVFTKTQGVIFLLELIENKALYSMTSSGATMKLEFSVYFCSKADMVSGLDTLDLQ